MAANGRRRVRPILSGGEDFGEDRSRARGHGDKYHPFEYADVRAGLHSQVDAIRSTVEELPDRYRGDRVIIQAKLHPNYLAASHHPRVLRADADLVVVGTRAARGKLRRRSGGDEDDARTKTLLFAATNESLNRMSDLLADPSPPSEIADEFVRFETFSLPGNERVTSRRPEETVDDPEAELTWEAILHPAVDVTGRTSERAADLIIAKLDALLRSFDGELRRTYLRQVGGLTFVPVRLRRRHLTELSRFNPLRAVRPMPRMRRIPDQRLRGIDLGSTAPPPPSGGPPATRRIAAFDGGVDATHPLLAPYVAEGDLTTAPRDDDMVSHGSLVASALLYGHITPGRPLEPPPAHVDLFRVMPAPPEIDDADEMYWVLDRIVETVRAHPDRWPIINLSLGPEDSTVDDDDDVDRFTAEIDGLIYDLGLTVVVAVGNDGQATISTLGEDRVQSPADGVNVLAVGACDDLHPEEPTRAEYSCVGPGRAGLRVAPLGVAFGGSDTQRFLGADLTGGYQQAAGTSFASPTAARGLATLLGSVPRVTANLTRALAAQFAVPPRQRDVRAVGYGRLRDDYRPLLNCEDGHVTVVVEDSIERAATREYPLPFPLEGVDGRVQATWTVSFVSPVDPQDAVEYTQAGLEVVLRPNAAAYMMSLKNSRQKPVDVDLRTDGDTIQRLAQRGWELSLNPKTRSGKAIRSEQTLRDEGKWETVVRHEDRANPGTYYRPSIWVTYFERSEGQLVPKDTATALDFTLVMTVKASKVPDLYERVLADARFAVLTPLTVPVRARA